MKAKIAEDKGRGPQSDSLKLIELTSITKKYSLNALTLVYHSKKNRFLSSGYRCNHGKRVYHNSDSIKILCREYLLYFFIVGDKAYETVVNLRIPETNRGIYDYNGQSAE